jgi:membrane-associated phospholipid phosphatase
VALMLGMLVVVAATVPVDEMVHDSVFRYVVSHEARLVANGATLLGTAWAGAGLLGTLAVVGYRTGDAVLWRGSLGGLAGVALGGAAAQVVKSATCRARPRVVTGWGVGSMSPAPVDATHGFFHWPCVWRWRYQSFPSGHATTAFTVASALVALAPRRQRLWLAIAAGVGASRVLLNAHYLSDVVAGGLIGWEAGQAGQSLAGRFASRFWGEPPRAAPAEVPPPEGTSAA